MPSDQATPNERPERSDVALEEAGDSGGSKNNDPVKLPDEVREPHTTGNPLVGDDVAHEGVSAGRPKFDKIVFVDEAPLWITQKWWKVPGDPDNHFENLLKPLLEKEDKQCSDWKEEVQNLLILAGLFSAIVTAFIIESYQTLQPDPNDQIISLLSRIADQTSSSNGSISSQHLSPLGLDFTPSPANIRINIYWFISLVLSLTVALVGIVTLQWLREYQRYDPGVQSMDWFAIFNARADGLQRWYVPQIFTGLPLLLQAALVLFFVGLVEFLFAINIEVAVLVSLSIAIPIIFLLATTILPTLQLYTLHLPYFLRVNDNAPAPCPYKSPQAIIFQRAAVASTTLFRLSTLAFGALCIPFVILRRLFVRDSKPFYTKSAPFRKTEDHYQYACDRLRNATWNWIDMDMQWPVARTSYAMSIQMPDTFIHLPSQHLSNDKFANVSGFYDCINGIGNIVGRRVARNDKETTTVFHALGDVYWRLVIPWWRPLRASSQDPELGQALQRQITALFRVLGPFGQQQIEKFVQQSSDDDDMVVIHSTLLAVIYDRALGPELNLPHQFFGNRALRHLILAEGYLSKNTEEVFQCSNLPGITLSLSLSTRQVIA